MNYKIVILGLILVLSSLSAEAQTVSKVCVASGSNCVPVSPTNPLPIGVYGGTSGYCLTSNGASSAATFQACGSGGITLNLGTSVSAANPRITSDATSGFYTAGAGKVDVTIGGVNVAEWTSAGQSLASPLLGVSGGTGVSNSGKTITLGGNLITSGAFGSTFTMTGTTSVTFPTSGTLSTTTGTVTSVTFTGDGTVLSSTPSSAVTTTGTLTAALATAAAQTVLGNATGSSATPTYTTAPVVSGASTAASFNATTVSTGYLLNSANALRFPAADSGTAGNTIAIGPSALGSLPSSAAYNNIAIGASALGSASITTNQTGSTAVGKQALDGATSGNHNTALGNTAGHNMTSGSGNTFIGYSAAGGSGSMTGSNTTVVGSTAGSALSASGGGTNTLIGAVSGSTITSGTGNTVLGANVASSTLTTGANNILIGVSSAITTSGSSTGNTINIGGTGGSWVLVTGSDTNTTANTIAHGVWNMPDLTATSAAQTGTVCSGTAGVLTVDTTVACLASLEELKDQRGSITNALKIVMNIKPFWFTWKKETPEYAGDKYEQPGVGAHQVESVDKRLVAYGPEGKLRGVRYQEMTAVLISAIQEQNSRIDILEKRISVLEAK